MSHRRLLIVVNDPRFFVTHRMALALAAQEAGWRVSAAVPDERGIDDIRGAGLPVHVIPLDRQGLNPMADIRTIVALTRLYRSAQPDVVHHITIKPVLYGTIAARLARVPRVVNAITGLGTLFGTGGHVRRAVTRSTVALYRLALGHPNATTIFQNENDRAVFAEHGVVDPAQTVVIPGSGVDPTLFPPMPEPEGPPTVVLTARLLRQKGIYEFVQAARLVRAGGVAARFALVGDTAGNRDAVPEDQLASWADEGIVELWGWQTDMAAVLRRTTVGCLPSYYPEGVPKALIEAATAGRPVVTTDTPGCRDIVRDGENGFLVPPRDPMALADALRRLLVDPGLRARLGQAGREHAIRRFSVDKVNAATLAVYSGIIEGSGATGGDAMAGAQ